MENCSISHASFWISDGQDSDTDLQNIHDMALNLITILCQDVSLSNRLLCGKNCDYGSLLLILGYLQVLQKLLGHKVIVWGIRIRCILVYYFFGVLRRTTKMSSCTDRNRLRFYEEMKSWYEYWHRFIQINHRSRIHLINPIDSAHYVDLVPDSFFL